MPSRPFPDCASRPRAFCKYLLCTSAFLAPLAAQTTNATLSGTITDPSGKVVPTVSVAATNTDSGVGVNTRTNNDGLYVLPSLLPGHYQLTVDKQGFKRIELRDVTLDVAETSVRNFHLELGPVSETVTVQGNGVSLNTSDGSVSTIISREFIDDLPLNGRTLQNLLPLSPGIVPDGISSGNRGASGYSVNGNRDTSSVNWTVDGISVNIGAAGAGTSPDSLAAGLSGLSTTQSLISLDALEEFRVSTSSYSVEYGVSPGAQIQLQSRSGTNQFHGSLFEYLRNEDLDANDWFNVLNGIARPPERQSDFGGTFSGTVLIPHVYNGRDKFFFFFSYEGLRLVQPTVLTDQVVPTAAYRQSAPAVLQSLLNAFPLPNGGPIGDTGWGFWNTASSQPSVVQAWNIRGDYALAKSTRIFGRFNYSPSNTQNEGNAFLSKNTTNTLTATIGLTTTFTANLSNDFRLNYSQQSLNSFTGPLPASAGGDSSGLAAALIPPAQFTPGNAYASDVVFTDPALGASAVVNLSQAKSNLHQWNIVDGLKWQIGRHSLKFGGEWNRHTANQQPVPYSQTLYFESLDSIQSATVDEGDIQAAPLNINTILTRSALYAGDTWRVTKRLTLDYGLRWELPFPAYFRGPYTPFYVSSIADSANPTTTQGRTQWDMTWRNFAPRFGAAYSLSERSGLETILRVGGGLFYSTETGSGFGNIDFPNTTYGSFYSVPYPVDPSLLIPPPIGVVTPDTLGQATLSGFDRNLSLPRVWQWNLSIEQALGKDQSLTVSYVGSAGRRLFFQPVILPASGVFSDVVFTENGSQSNYNALQLKFNRRLARGLQALISYTWAHSIDNVSTNNFNYLPLWGNSDFDVRNNISAAIVYNIPGAGGDRALRAITSGWSLSTNFNAHTGLPVTNMIGNVNILPNGSVEGVLPDLVPDVPIYLHGPEYPGGTALNRAAFVLPADGEQGDVGRNAFRGLDFWQLDASMQRKFVLGEKAGSLRLRVDGFNLLNHPNFAGYFVTNLSTSPAFGMATSMANQFGGSSPLYNSGGPRSLQVSLKYEF